MKQPVCKQPHAPSGASVELSVYDGTAPNHGARYPRRSAKSVDARVTPESVCGWCLGAHPTAGCPRGPRLSMGAVVAFAVEAMGRGGRVWA